MTHFKILTLTLLTGLALALPIGCKKKGGEVVDLVAATESAEATLTARLPAGTDLEAVPLDLYAYPEVVPAGTVVRVAGSDVTVTVPAESWLIWADPEPEAKWAHTTLLQVVDADTGAVAEHELPAMPYIEGDEHGWGEGGAMPPSADQVASRFAQASPVQRFPEGHESFVAPLQSMGPCDPLEEICTPTRYAVIIIGNASYEVNKDTQVKTFDPDELENMAQDVAAARRFFQSTAMGVAADNLMTYDSSEGTQSFQTIMGDIVALEMKCCDELFIYYSGHNSANKNELALDASDSSSIPDIDILTMKTLLKGLANDAQGHAYTLILDTCYSEYFANEVIDRYEQDVKDGKIESDRADIMVLYSSGADESSKAGNNHGHNGRVNDGSWFTQQVLDQMANDFQGEEGAAWWSSLASEMAGRTGGTIELQGVASYLLPKEQTSGYAMHSHAENPCPCCGDGVVQEGESCDPGSDETDECSPILGGDTCTDECQCVTLTVCGDGYVGWDEDCDPGTTEPDAACDGGVCVGCLCVGEHCGNGALDPNEDCDPGSADTMTCAEPGTTCMPNCSCAPTDSYCGDGIVNENEDCDPGNAGSVKCDEGFTCMGCTCQELVSSCGDGIVGPGEDCDHAAQETFLCGEASDEFCNSACECVPLPVCGDGLIEEPEGCDPGSEETLACEDPDAECFECDCMVFLCGNGVLDPSEECDEGSPVTADCGVGGTCEACQCVGETVCGDGIVAFQEECDPGSLETMTCADPAKICTDCICWATNCGNGLMDEGEECDPGLGNALVCGDDTFLCNPDCTCQPTLPVCDDGYVTSPEQCDPSADPTGCDEGFTCLGCTCQELVATCGDGVIGGEEECDHGDPETEGVCGEGFTCVGCQCHEKNCDDDVDCGPGCYDEVTTVYGKCKDGLCDWSSSYGGFDCMQQLGLPCTDGVCANACGDGACPAHCDGVQKVEPVCVDGVCDAYHADTVKTNCSVVADGGYCEDGECKIEQPVFVDEAAGLMWRDTQWDIGSMGWGLAQIKCGEPYAGYEDWHVPSLDEARTLVRGCPDIMPGGACGASNGCTDLETCYSHEGCYDNACENLQGPGKDGHYQPIELQTKLGSIWTSTAVTPGGDGAPTHFGVNFAQARVVSSLWTEMSTAKNRCVRSATE